MDERPGWTWVTDAAEAIAADVHHRHGGADWFAMPAGFGLRLARLLLQTPGTYTHSSVLTAAAAAAPTAARPATPTPREAPRKRRTVGASAVAQMEGDYVKRTGSDRSLDDRWVKLARANGLEVNRG